MEQWQIEEIILGMADIVIENRQLREENKRLRKIEKEYHQSIMDRCRESEQASLNMLKAAMVGVVQGKNDKELANDLKNIFKKEKNYD